MHLGIPPRFMIMTLALFAVVGAVGQAWASADTEIRFTCDDSGNLTRFQYGKDVTFSLGKPTPGECQAVEEAVERCERSQRLGQTDAADNLAALEAIVMFIKVSDSGVTSVDEKRKWIEAECRKMKSSVEEGESFTYKYPYDGYSRKQIGHNGTNKMDKEQFKRVAELAVAGGIDPFLALSILVTEQTPLADNKSLTEGYFSNYGVFPVDGWPAASFLKCSVEKSQFPALKRDNIAFRTHASKVEALRSEFTRITKGFGGRTNRLAHDIASLGTQLGMASVTATDRRWKVLEEKVKEYDELREKGVGAASKVEDGLPKGVSAGDYALLFQYATCGDNCVALTQGSCKQEPCAYEQYPMFDFSSSIQPAQDSILCSESVPITSGAPFQVKEASPSIGSCCFRVKMAPVPLDDHKQTALGALGLRVFWDDKILRALKQVKNEGERVSKIDGGHAHRLARIAQRWNGWGKMGVSEKINSCLSGLDMSQKPVIGAKAMDFMINSTLTNPYLTGLIHEISSAQKKPVPSLLCRYAGSGEKTMRAKAFYTKINQEYLASKCR